MLTASGGSAIGINGRPFTPPKTETGRRTLAVSNWLILALRHRRGPEMLRLRISSAVCSRQCLNALIDKEGYAVRELDIGRFGSEPSGHLHAAPLDQSRPMGREGFVKHPRKATLSIESCPCGAVPSGCWGGGRFCSAHTYAPYPGSRVGSSLRSPPPPLPSWERSGAIRRSLRSPLHRATLLLSDGVRPSIGGVYQAHLVVTYGINPRAHFINRATAREFSA
jgi:hypothetical protein